MRITLVMVSMAMVAVGQNMDYLEMVSMETIAMERICGVAGMCHEIMGVILI